LGGLIIDLDRYVERQGGSKARMLSSYDSGPWKVSRVGKQAFIPRACLSVFGTIQPSALKEVFSTDDFGSGFLPRFLFCWVKRNSPVQWTDETVSDRARQCLDSAIKSLITLDFNENGDSITVRASPGARRNIWIPWFNRQAARPWVDPDSEDFEAVLAKLRGQALRFALILHYLGDGGDHDPVSDAEMASAVQLADYFQLHARAAWAAVRDNQEKEPSPIERRVIAAILSLEGEIRGGRLRTSRVTERVNEGVGDHFQLSVRTVGRAASKIGIRVGLIPGGKARCLILSENDLTVLKDKFPVLSQDVTNVTVAGNKMLGTCARDVSDVDSFKEIIV
jgi:hypothetical protein